MNTTLPTSHRAFKTYEVKDSCTWYGTSWSESGNLLPCSQPSVGAGLFCTPDHKNCEIHSLCENHANNCIAVEWRYDEQ